MNDRAGVLRDMLEALIEHREKSSAPTRWVAVNFEEVLEPRWKSRADAAAKDGIEQSLHASIREEGWRAFAEGGLPAMHELCDEACGDNDYMAVIVDHRWDGIGNERRGVWAC